jgi:hypothetical protein
MLPEVGNSSGKQKSSKRKSGNVTFTVVLPPDSVVDEVTVVTPSLSQVNLVQHDLELVQNTVYLDPPPNYDSDDSGSVPHPKRVCSDQHTVYAPSDTDGAPVCSDPADFSTEVDVLMAMMLPTSFRDCTAKI